MQDTCCVLAELRRTRIEARASIRTGLRFGRGLLLFRFFSEEAAQIGPISAELKMRRRSCLIQLPRRRETPKRHRRILTFGLCDEDIIAVQCGFYCGAATTVKPPDRNHPFLFVITLNLWVLAAKNWPRIRAAKTGGYDQNSEGLSVL